MDVNGAAGNPVTIESSSVISPSISGNNEKIYVVYGKNNQIVTKYLINGTSNWQSLQTINLSVNANSIESVVSNNKLHITYALSNQIKHRSFQLNGSSWSSDYTVSNTEAGSSPRIAAWYTGTEDKVYFVYQNTSSLKKFRDYNVANNSWGTIKEAFNVANSEIRGLCIDANYVYFYYTFYQYEPTWEIFFQEQKRTKSGQWINTSWAELGNFTDKIFTATTINNVSSIAYYYNGLVANRGTGSMEPGIVRFINDGSTFGDVDVAYPDPNIEHPTPWVNLSTASNDVYIIWKDALGLNIGNNLRFKYFDVAPLVPPNFQITNSGSPSYHPVLIWNQLNEPDVRIKSNGLRVERSLEVLGQWSAWTEIAAISGSSVNYTDSEIFNATGAGNGRAKYRIRSYDDGGHFSPYSNEITIRFGTSAEKIVVLGSSSVEQYSLGHNFPNPFNPSTKISYSIKEEGLVTLKVYDILGKEITTLVNENKPAGIYEVEFNASHLPSGMYIYKIQASSFSDVKKMLLTK
jgi:Secretion system C-terminal sorting domain